MGLRLCVLASGSSGNCTYVASRTTAILIDAGISARAIAERLARIGVPLEDISAVCVTHEHGDHVGGLGTLHAGAGMPLYANRGTLRGLHQREGLSGVRSNVFRTGEPFSIGDLVINAFPVQHDTEEPVGFVITGRSAAIGVSTDLGEATATVQERLSACDAVVIESNHDEEMLMASGRPRWLKERIRGPDGHLSNAGAGDLLFQIAGPHLQRVFLAHLSTECNTPAKARRAAADSLRRSGHGHVPLSLTHPDRVSEVWEAGLESSLFGEHPVLG
jgi:phosphoribosyl 1,2-cyclic phosphodiesterase